MKQSLSLFITLFFLSNMLAQTGKNPFLKADDIGQLSLTEAGASHFAQLALTCLQQEYPNKLNQVLNDASSLEIAKYAAPCILWLL